MEKDVERQGTAHGRVMQSREAHTVYVHPALLSLDRAILLHFVHAVAQCRLDRLVQHFAEIVCAEEIRTTRNMLHGVMNVSKSQGPTWNAPLSTKSFSPAPSPSPLAGSHPITEDETTDGGGVGRNDNANTGCAEDKDVGGVKRW